MSNKQTKQNDIKTTPAKKTPPKTKAIPINQLPLNIKENATLNNIVLFNNSPKGKENQVKNKMGHCLQMLFLNCVCYTSALSAIS